MKASETKFQHVIEGTKQYVVPLFQRPYSWDIREWSLLWDDLLWLSENREPKSHFIGSIVTMPTVSVPEGVTKYLLIDGQQRLTTIFIILALLRNQASFEQNHDLSQEIEQNLLINRFKKGNDYFKLLPTQVNRLAFTCLMDRNQECPDEIEEDKITACYMFFQRKLMRKKIEIQALYHIIVNRLSVVSIVLDYDDNPHLVFESLNAKGRPLTQPDLIRNFFFMRVDPTEQEYFHAQYWQPMEAALNHNLTDYIRHYLMRNGTIVKQDDVYFTLKDQVKQDQVKAALKDLFEFSKYYVYLLDPNREAHPKLGMALTRLKRLEVTTAFPFLLNCYREYDEERISVDEFEKILDILENYMIRRFVCNRPTSLLNKVFPLLYTQALTQGASNLVDGVRAILQLRDYPKDSEFRARLLDNRLYGSGERLQKTKLILERLELAHGHKEKIALDSLTVEHVMPQTITDWWRDHLGEDYETQHELYLHTLGNLTLTGYNSEMSNGSFFEKKKRLLASHLELNSHFDALKSWDKEAIQQRGEVLASIALNVWVYFGTAPDESMATNDVKGKTPKMLTILGQHITVKSWVDVQENTLGTIAELEPDAFINLAQQYPRFISLEQQQFRRSRQLRNGYYIESNLSSRDIYRFCMQAVEASGLSSEDWSVETD